MLPWWYQIIYIIFYLKSGRFDVTEICKKKFSKSVVIGWVVLTLSCRQTIFLFINATAVTLGQGHRRVTQYIFPDVYFLYPKYQRFAQTVLTWEAKVIEGSGGGRGRGGGNELLT